MGMFHCPSPRSKINWPCVARRHLESPVASGSWRSRASPGRAREAARVWRRRWPRPSHARARWRRKDCVWPRARGLRPICSVCVECSNLMCGTAPSCPEGKRPQENLRPLNPPPAPCRDGARCPRRKAFAGDTPVLISDKPIDRSKCVNGGWSRATISRRVPDQRSSDGLRKTSRFPIRIAPARCLGLELSCLAGQSQAPVLDACGAN